MKNEQLCPWCYDREKPLKVSEIEWSVLDDDFGQFVSTAMIHYCFSCGRKLKKAEKET